MANMIEIRGLNKYFGDLHVLKDIDLTVEEGEKVVIIGPSGSGKSTLIRCVDFLEEPTSGEVMLVFVRDDSLGQALDALLAEEAMGDQCGHAISFEVRTTVAYYAQLASAQSRK